MPEELLQSLLRYLASMPRGFDYHMDVAARRHLRRALYYAASNKGRHIDKFFPDLAPAHRDELDEGVYGCGAGTTGEWHIDQNANRNPSHPHRPCARKFMKGEPIYRCLTCGIDETCAMCALCFCREDHEGHMLVSTICTRSNLSGICDCGDPEAWKVPVRCSNYYAENGNDADLLADLEESFFATIESVFDYLVDVLRHLDIVYLLNLELLDKEIVAYSELCGLDLAFYDSTPDPNSDEYCLVLYNDCVHHQRDAVLRIRAALGRVPEFAEMVTEQVELYGKAVVLTLEDVGQLRECQQVLSLTGLHTSIRSARDVFREDMCDEIVKWMCSVTANLPLFTLYDAPSDWFSRLVVRKWRHNWLEACVDTPQDWRHPSQRVLETEEYVPGRLLNKTWIPVLPHFPTSWCPTYWDTPATLWELPQELCEDARYNLWPLADSVYLDMPFVGSRFQYLLYFDIRLWDHVRPMLHDLYIEAMVGNLKYRAVQLAQYVDIHAMLTHMYYSVDREPENNLMCMMLTQFFTSPLHATAIARHGDLLRMMATGYGLLTMEQALRPLLVDLSRPALVQSVRNRRWGIIFLDMRYVLLLAEQPEEVFSVLFVLQACDFLALFQGHPLLQRAAVEHVEYELNDYTFYFAAFQMVLRWAENVAGVITRFDGEQRRAEGNRAVLYVVLMLADIDQNYYPGIAAGSIDAGPLTIKAYSTGSTAGGVLSTPEFAVHQQKISIIHPLQAFLLWLVEAVGYAQPRDIYTNVNLWYQGPHLLQLYEYNLRTVVALAQVKTGFWVRNGYSVKNLMQMYRLLAMREAGFVRDLYMCQMCASSCDPDSVMLLFLERWLLMRWRANGHSDWLVYDKLTLVAMVEEFLNFLLWLATDTMFLLVNHTKEDVLLLNLRREIVHMLALLLPSYSKLQQEVPENIAVNKKFEAVLAQVSTFVAPSGVSDSGKYVLKDECYSEVDPYNVHLTLNRREECIKIIKQRLATRDGVSVDQVCIMPPADITDESAPGYDLGMFAHVAGFTTLLLFVQFVGSTTRFVLADPNANEGICDVLLHMTLVASFELHTDKLRSVGFYDHLFTSFDQEESLVVLLHRILGEPLLAAHHAKVKAVFRTIHERHPEFGPRLAGSVELSPEGLRWALGSDAGGPDPLGSGDEGELEGDRKKRLAKQRRERIMALFKAKQLRFVAIHDTDGIDLSDVDMGDGDGRHGDRGEPDTQPGELDWWRFPDHHCILCQLKEEGDGQVFGIVLYLAPFSCFREVPFEDPYWAVRAFADPMSLDTEEDPQAAWCPRLEQHFGLFKQKKPFGPGFPTYGTDGVLNTQRHLVVTLCGHGMHFSCYKNYLSTSRTRQSQVTRTIPEDPLRHEFLCPLCKAVNNVFVPVFWTHSKRPWSLLQGCDGDETEEPQSWSAPFENPQYDEHLAEEELNKVRRAITGELVSRARTCMAPAYISVLDDVGADEERLHELLFGAASSNTPGDRSPSTHTLISSQHRYGWLSLVLGDVVGNIQQLLEPVCFGGDFLVLLAKLVEQLEILLRGYGQGNVLDQIPNQLLVCLRVWNELRNLVLAIRAKGEEQHLHLNATPTLVEDVVGQFVYMASDSVFPGLVQGVDYFQLLVDCKVVALVGYSFVNNLRLCLTLHLLQTVYTLMMHLTDLQVPDEIVDLPVAEDADDTVGACVCEMLQLLQSSAGRHCRRWTDVLARHEAKSPIWQVLYLMVKRMCVPFLRRAAIWGYVQCHVREQAEVVDTADEADRLCSMLGIPTVKQLVMRFGEEGAYEAKALEQLGTYIHGLRHGPGGDLLVVGPRSGHSSLPVPPIQYPGHIRLIDLMPRMDMFFSEYFYEEDNYMVQDPALCLFCGAVVPVQHKVIGEARGSCNLHYSENCMHDAGIFLLPRLGTVLLLWNGKGTFHKAPFLDAHGELDEEPRQTKPLFLNKVRYDALIRKVWLGGGIVHMIARNLETAVDIGGWETM